MLTITDAQITDPQLARQFALETHAMEQGRQRFLARVQKATAAGQVSTVGGGLQLTRNAIDPVEAAVHHFLTEGEELETFVEGAERKRGNRHIAAKMLRLLGPDGCAIAAFIATRVVLNGVLRRIPVAMAGREIADLILDQIRFARLRDAAPALFDYKMTSFDTSNYEHRAKSLASTLHGTKVLLADGTEGFIDTSDLDLPQTQRVALGVKLIDLLIAATQLVSVEDVSAPRKTRAEAPRTTKVLVAEPETLRWITESNEAMLMLWPVMLPMVVEPLPWSGQRRGGYLYALKGKTPFVRGASKAQVQAMGKTDMSIVYGAVNAIQKTAWRINTDVADLLEEIVSRHGGLGGIPELGIAPEPPKPEAHPEFDAMLKERRKMARAATKGRRKLELEPLEGAAAAYAEQWQRWRRKAAGTHNENYARRTMRTEVSRLLSVVGDFREEPRMYFVYNVDFRGRVYPVSNYLTPQGDDRSKALLTFADGRALGPQGTRYLAQHGMSCLGETPDGRKVSKMTIQERVEWVESHGEMIRLAATEPLYNRWWSAPTVDDKLQFFAFCCEWTRLLAWRATGGADGDFVSSLPCAVDGSCNGLQHYSMAWLDSIGGEAVNLTPTERPQDIYLKVTGRILEIMERDAANPALLAPTQVERRVMEGSKKVKIVQQVAGKGTLAVRWLTSGLVNRSLCKRPVMTFPYGSRVFGFRMQVLAYLQGRGDSPQESKTLWRETQLHFTNVKDGDLLASAASYFASCAMEAMRDVVVSAAQGMAWMQHAARLVASTGKCVTWKVPGTGFPVVQAYMVQKERRVDTILCGSVFKPVVWEDTADPAVYKQANAVAPNVVHSLDAAALMQTVRMASTHGVQSFAMIHDSYGAPAGDCAVLADATRRSFLALYTEQDVVESLWGQFAAQLDEEKLVELLPPPEKGTLDPAGVVASEYFFA